MSHLFNWLTGAGTRQQQTLWCCNELSSLGVPLATALQVQIWRVMTSRDPSIVYCSGKEQLNYFSDILKPSSTFASKCTKPSAALSVHTEKAVTDVLEFTSPTSWLEPKSCYFVHRKRQSSCVDRCKLFYRMEKYFFLSLEYYSLVSSSFQLPSITCRPTKESGMPEKRRPFPILHFHTAKKQGSNSSDTSDQLNHFIEVLRGRGQDAFRIQSEQGDESELQITRHWTSVVTELAISTPRSNHGLAFVSLNHPSMLQVLENKKLLYKLTNVNRKKRLMTAAGFGKNTMLIKIHIYARLDFFELLWSGK